MSIADRYSIRVKNTTSDIIPPYGVMRILTAAAEGQDENYLVGQWDGTSKAKYLLNGPQAIGANGYGAATDQYPTLALAPGGGGLGAEWGPIPGSWALSPNGKGFLVLGGDNGTTVTVAAIPPGATESGDFPLIQVQNKSGVRLLNRHIVGISNTLLTPPAIPVNDVNNALFTPIQPLFESEPPYEGFPFAVLTGDVNNDAIIDAVPLGTVLVRLNYLSEDHNYAIVESGNYARLRSAHGSHIQILWRERQGTSGSLTLGVQWAIVHIGFQHTDTVVIDRPILASQWDAQTKQLTPGITFLPYLYHIASDPDHPDKLQYNPAVTTPIMTRFTTQISVNDGHGRIAEVVDGRIYNVDCNEIELEASPP